MNKWMVLMLIAGIFVPNMIVALEDPIGLYMGMAMFRRNIELDMTKALDTTYRMDTGAIIDRDNDLADPDLEYNDVQHRDSGYGLRIGYLKDFNPKIGFDGFIEYGFVEGTFSFKEKDTGGAVQERLFSNNLSDDTSYLSYGAGVFGELGEVKGKTLSWTAGLVYSFYSDSREIDKDAGDPKSTEGKFEFADISMETTFGVELESTRLFLGLRFTNSRVEYSETEKDLGAGPPAEKNVLEYRGEWDAAHQLFLGADAGSDKFKGYARYYLTGSKGAEAGLMWLF